MVSIKRTATVCLSVIMLSLSGCQPGKSDRFVFTYAQEQPLGSLRGQSMAFFEQELELRSNGRIQVEIYCGGVLGTERELMDLVATGALQGTRGGFFADANPKFNIIMLPFLVEGWDQALRLVNSDFMRRINQGARSHGWHVPATGISQGFRAHTNNVRPITRPEDLQGLKMRVPPQDVFVRTATAFGANPQEIPAVETYQSLQTGVVDGQDNAPSNIWDYKVHEVSKYLSITNYAIGPDPFLVNLAWHEGLPAELKAVFDEVAQAAISLSDRLNREQEAEYIAKLSERLEVNFVTGDALDAFRQSVAPVYQHYIDLGAITAAEIAAAQAAARNN